MKKPLRRGITAEQAIHEAIKPSPVTGKPLITMDSLKYLRRYLDEYEWPDALTYEERTKRREREVNS